MPTVEGIGWFKQQFHKKIEAAVAGTPFTLDMITAIACQETGYIWNRLRKKGLATDRILELCVGDTIDSSGGRSAFPTTKSDLLSRPNGQAMFDIARKALVDMAQYMPDYAPSAAKPNKFCHGFGIFQYDLQFFKVEPDYFLNKSYANFDETLAKCISELRSKMKKLGWQNKTSLTGLEMAAVAIAYNTGNYIPSRGLKQGYKPKGGKHYGEQYYDYLRLSATVPTPSDGAPVPTEVTTTPVLPEPTPVAATGKVYAVDVRKTMLRLRSEPKISKPNSTKNVIARLPDGHLVKAVTNKIENGFREVETSLFGAHFHGWASADYLKAVPEVDSVPVLTPVVEPAPAPGGIVAVYMPRKQGTVTKRTEIAGPHSLNEPNQPTRRAGGTYDELRSDLAEIIKWLNVEKQTHHRYKPRNGLTFCNIYAHDYCFLADVYLPRVWWTPGAIADLAAGKPVKPLYGSTIEEIRANGLFRWLRDFGLGFGWRQTGTLSKLQAEVNQGAIGLIVARRKEEGRSGHIVMVVPETDARTARRDAAGNVIAPLQSQAGATNFSYGTSKVDWWKGAQFAESAFWIHA